jgi:hypothetical protein
MFKIISLILAAGLFLQIQTSASATGVAIYQRCGGVTNNTSWILPCDTGLNCCYMDQWYSQCLQSCAKGLATTVAPTTVTYPPVSSAPCSLFTNGTFQLGISYDQTNKCTLNLNGYDYITIWLEALDQANTTTDFDPWYQGAMVNCSIKNQKLPVFYAYIIATEAKHKIGLKDCNVDANWNLCKFGSQFIRDNRALLVDRYHHYASKIAAYLGSSAKTIFLIEPDFWQYYGTSTQQGGALSGPYMKALFDDFVSAIKSHLPNALISFDISAWLSQDQYRTW